MAVRNLCLLFCFAVVANGARVDDDADAKPEGAGFSLDGAAVAAAVAPVRAAMKAAIQEVLEENAHAASVRTASAGFGHQSQPFDAVEQPRPCLNYVLQDSEDKEHFVTRFDTVSNKREPRPDIGEDKVQAKEEEDCRLLQAKRDGEDKIHVAQEAMNQKVREVHEQALKSSADKVEAARRQAQSSVLEAETKAQKRIKDGHDFVTHKVQCAEAATEESKRKRIAAVEKESADFKAKETDKINKMQQELDADLNQTQGYADHIIGEAEKAKQEAVANQTAQTKAGMFRLMNNTQNYEGQRVMKSAAMGQHKVEQAQIVAAASISKAEEAKAASDRQAEENLNAEVHNAKMSVAEAESTAAHQISESKSAAQTKVANTKTQTKSEYNGTVHHFETMAVENLKAIDARSHDSEASTMAEVQARKSHEVNDSATALGAADEKVTKKLSEIRSTTDEMRKQTLRDQMAIQAKLKTDMGQVDDMVKQVVEKAELALKTAKDKLCQEEKNANVHIQISTVETEKNEKIAHEDYKAKLEKAQAKAKSVLEARNSASEKLKAAEAEALEKIRYGSEVGCKRASNTENVNKQNIEEAENVARARVHDLSLHVSERVHQHMTKVNATVTAADEAIKADIHHAQSASESDVEKSHAVVQKAKENVEETKASAERILSETQAKAEEWVKQERDQASKRVEEVVERMANYHEDAAIAKDSKEQDDHLAQKLKDANSESAAVASVPSAPMIMPEPTTEVIQPEPAVEVGASWWPKF